MFRRLVPEKRAASLKPNASKRKCYRFTSRSSRRGPSARSGRPQEDARPPPPLSLRPDGGAAPPPPEQGRAPEEAPLSPAPAASSKRAVVAPVAVSKQAQDASARQQGKEEGRRKGARPGALTATGSLTARHRATGQRCHPRGSGQPRFGQGPGRAQSPPRGTVCLSILSRGPRPRPGSSYCPGSAPGTSPPPSWAPTHWRFRQEPDAGAPSPPEVALARLVKPLPPFIPFVSASLLSPFGAM